MTLTAAQLNLLTAPGLPMISNDSTREELINWLVSNDRNGCYSDADCIAEWGEPMTRDEAIESLQMIADDIA